MNPERSRSGFIICGKAFYFSSVSIYYKGVGVIRLNTTVMGKITYPRVFPPKYFVKLKMLQLN